MSHTQKIRSIHSRLSAYLQNNRPMTTLKFNLILVLVLATGIFFSSCSEEETTPIENIENYTEDAVFIMQRNAKVGIRGCFELVFPIDLVFPDGTTASVDSYSEMKTAIRTWKVDNPDAEDKPRLGYPLDIMTDEGEIITAESKEELVDATKGCVREYINSHPRLNNSCYRVQFPTNIELPSGEIVTLEDREDLKRLLRRWKNAYPTQAKPKLAFPLIVKIKETDELVTVNSREELVELKRICRGE